MAEDVRPRLTGMRDQDGVDRSSRWSLAWSYQGWLSWAPLVAVVVFAFALNAWGLSENGYGNTYYAAAVRSMTLSWKNFLFGSLDPGGFITVDKPPVMLWAGAVSARLFGYSSWSLLLPSAVAGAASVALVWLITRRYFGAAAATIAALVLALTPIWVAIHRLNQPEPFYVLALVAAAAATLRSLESRRWWAWTVAAGLLVGVAFNTKMLAGWIPGPALALAVFVGVGGPWRTVWRQWLPRLAVLGAVTIAASASWLLLVDTWPESDRPYVGGSGDNTVSDLVLGYNGLDRVDGVGLGFGGGAGGPPTGGGFASPGGGFPLPGGGPTGPSVGPGGGINPGNQRDGGFNPGNQRDGGTFNPGGGGGAAAPTGGGFNGPGGIIAGAPDLLRMFDPANSGQIAWFLPFALLGGGVSLWRWRERPVLRAAVVLWLGWVLLFGGVFSYSQGIYHSYYTAALAPGIAALVGVSCVAFADLVRRNRAWLAAPIATAGATLWVQLVIAGRFPGFFDWVEPLTVITVVVGFAIVVATIWRRLPVIAGLAVVVAGLLLIPAAWSTYETAHASLNATLPQAGPREGAAGRSFGSSAFDTGVDQLAAWLEAQRQPGSRWDLAVSSAQNASTLIAEHGLSVMALGGFAGGDPTITAAEFAELVAAGDLRYVLTSGGMGGGRSFGPGGASSGAGAGAVISAVRAACEPVSDTSLPRQYAGEIYDCAGREAAIAAR